MARLIHKNKVLLSEMKYVKGVFGLFMGLRFASGDRIKKGICMVTSGIEEKRTPLDMLFCFYPYEILFVDSDFRVVGKIILKPWTLSYVPKKPCKYVIESLPGTFKNVKIGDKVKIMQERH